MLNEQRDVVKSQGFLTSLGAFVVEFNLPLKDLRLG